MERVDRESLAPAAFAPKLVEAAAAGQVVGRRSCEDRRTYTLDIEDLP